MILPSSFTRNYLKYENLSMQYTEIFFSEANIEIFIENFLIFSIFVFKPLIVGTR